MKVASLDLGSNTFLCLLIEGDDQGRCKIHRDMVQTVRLGQGVDGSGELHPDALSRAEKCLEEFASEIKKFTPDKVIAVATSAARDAKNSDKLFEIGKKLNIPITIISGKEEAEISFRGALFGFGNTEKQRLVVDIGGGSTELIIGSSGKIIWSKSLDIGAVRLTERHVAGYPVVDSDLKNLNEAIRQNLAGVVHEIKKIGAEEVVAVAGTPTALAALELGGFDERRIHGYEFSLKRLTYWCDLFAKTTVQEKMDKYGLGGRADIILAGTSILRALLEELDKKVFFVSTKGVRYGLAIRALGF
ncbi:MAG: Ppx/GppA family phosphatase [Bdellovibrionaceae bacterium]|nr:Ppx/GppA family phosphatase [Pseudobdellovibrionaceae bacterium]